MKKRYILISLFMLLFLSTGEVLANEYVPLGCSLTQLDACAGGIRTGHVICSNIQECIFLVTNVFFLLMIVATVVFIMKAGLKLITQGSEARALGSAKQSLLYSIVGFILVIVSWLIANIIFTTLN